MVVVIKKDTDESKVQELSNQLGALGVDVKRSDGEYEILLSLVGDTSEIDVDRIRSCEIVENVVRISDPFKNVSRKRHPDDAVIDIGGVKIGGGNFQFIAGPCSVESTEQICSIAEAVRAGGAGILRGGSGGMRRRLPRSRNQLLRHGRKTRGHPRKARDHSAAPHSISVCAVHRAILRTR